MKFTCYREACRVPTSLNRLASSLIEHLTPHQEIDSAILSSQGGPVRQIGLYTRQASNQFLGSLKGLQIRGSKHGLTPKTF